MSGRDPLGHQFPSPGLQVTGTLSKIAHGSLVFQPRSGAEHQAVQSRRGRAGLARSPVLH